MAEAHAAAPGELLEEGLDRVDLVLTVGWHGRSRDDRVGVRPVWRIGWLVRREVRCRIVRRRTRRVSMGDVGWIVKRPGVRVCGSKPLQIGRWSFPQLSTLNLVPG